MTQQEVIKAFMKALDTTTLKGEDALNEAIKACSTFKSFKELKTEIINDCKKAKSADDFLKTYCGIDYSTDDSGAITGLDAGGSVSKNDADIIPESGSLKTCTDSSFKKNNLTVKLGDGKTYDDLTKSQKFIWNGLYTWWVEGALNLVAESYGDNFSFTDKSSATVKEMAVTFVDKDNGPPAQTWHNYYIASGRTANIWLEINMHYWDSLKDNLTEANSGFDRTIAHEFTHAVMVANILEEPIYNSLPHFVKEGLADLTIGIKNSRKDLIQELNASKFESGLVVDDSNTDSSFWYEGGYTFFRYLARQAGDLTIENTGDSTVRTFRGNDTVTNFVSNAYIDSGEGADYVAVGSGAKKVTIASGTGNDHINNWSSQASIETSTGNDTIYNSSLASNAYLSSDTGNDSIDNRGARFDLRLPRRFHAPNRCRHGYLLQRDS